MEIILPKIVATGIYNAALAHKNTVTTKNRKTTMFELELPTEDGGISFIDGEAHPITKNSVICAKPGQIRHTRLPFKCYYIHIIVNEGELCDRLSKIPHFVNTDDGEREIYEKFFKEITVLYNASSEDASLMIHSRLLELIHILSEHSERMTVKETSHNKQMIERVIHYIEDNLTSELSLERVSKYASFSTIYFHNCFKRATGKTLREFVEERRIKRALSLLIGSDMTLAEIAYECGFSSQSYFSYAFKKAMKMTPREYAKAVHKRYEE